MNDKLKHWPKGKEVLQAGRSEWPKAPSSLVPATCSAVRPKTRATDKSVRAAPDQEKVSADFSRRLERENQQLRLALLTCHNLADWILEHTTGGDGTMVAARKIKHHAAMPNV